MLQDLFICHEKSVSWKNLRFINFSIFLFLKLDCGSGKNHSIISIFVSFFYFCCETIIFAQSVLLQSWKSQIFCRWGETNDVVGQQKFKYHTYLLKSISCLPMLQLFFRTIYRKINVTLWAPLINHLSVVFHPFCDRLGFVLCTQSWNY